MRSTIAMIFMPFPLPQISAPATLGHHERRVDEAFLFIQRTSVAKLWQHPSAAAAKSHRGTKPESADVPSCSWDSFAAAYAIAHLC
jgi:hypothetical protein